MKALAALLVSALLVGCAVAPPMPPAASLFHDELFAAPSTPIEPQAALAFAEECRRREHDDLLILKLGWNRGIPI